MNDTGSTSESLTRSLSDDIAFVDDRVNRVEALANLMDSRFHIPGLPMSLGLDTIIGLIPGIGDTVGLGVSAYIIYECMKLGLPKKKLPIMMFNVLVDWAIGLIPLLGDIFDMGWRANNKNVAMLRAHWDASPLYTHVLIRQYSQPHFGVP